MKTMQIAFRNTRRQTRRSGLLAGAIAFGMMIITLVNGLTAGMVESVKENFAGSLAGHIYITAEETTSSLLLVDRISDDDFLMEMADRFSIAPEQITRRSAFNGNLIFGSRQKSQEVQGIDMEAEKDLMDGLIYLDMDESFLEMRNSLILSEPLADELRAAVGDVVLVRLTTQTGQENLGEFILAGIMPDEGSFGADRAYARLAYVNELMNMPVGAYQSFNIRLDNMDLASRLAAQITTAMREAAGATASATAGATVEVISTAEEQADFSQADLTAMMESIMSDDPVEAEEGEQEVRDVSGRPGGMRGGGGFPGMGMATRSSDRDPGTIVYTVSTIDDYMSQIEQLMTTMNMIALGVFVILLGITMVGITNTFRMMMIERITEIGTMRAMGVHRKEIRSIFLNEAGIIAFVGAAVGFGLGGLIMLASKLIRLTQAGDFSIFLNSGRLSFAIQPGQTLGLVLLIVALSMLAALVPAGKAAAVEPAEALRTTK